MKTYNSIDSKLFDLLGSFTKARDVPIATATRLKEDLGVDSVDHLDLIFLLEKQFEVNLPDEELPQIKTVGELAKLITRQMRAHL